MRAVRYGAFDSAKYAGPGISYAGINSARTSGIVDFAESCTGNTASTCSPSSGLNNGESAFFSLENNLTGASIVIPKASPVISSTTPSPSVAVGGTISDSAVLANGRVPGGTLTFKLYGPGDTTCQSSISTLTTTVSGNGTYSSGTFTTTAPGTYSWTFSYSGDANNNPAPTTACGSETVIVTPQTLTGRAYGLAASASVAGLQLLTVNPTPDTGSVSTTKAETIAPACVVSLSGLINSSTLCASVTTSLNPSKSVAQASINSTTIGLPGLPVITVGAVQSQSTSTCQAESGSTTIAYLSVGGVVVISKPTAVAPNTKISVAGITLVLNEQLTSPGTLTVNAVHVEVNALGLSLVTANVVLASSTSDIENCP